MQTKLARLITRVLSFKLLLFNGTHIKLWGVPMVFLTYETLARLTHDLIENFGYEETFKTIYAIGRLQGLNGTNILKKKFNLDLSKASVNFYLEQISLIGFGKSEPEKYNQEPFELVIKNTSPLIEAYKRIYGNIERPINIYLSGMIGGAGETIWENNKLECEETPQEDGKFRYILASRDELPEIYTEAYEIFKELKNFENVKNLLGPVSLRTLKSELYTLLKRNINPITVKDGVITLFGIGGIITPFDILAILYNEFSKKNKEKTENIFLNLGVQSAEYMYTKIAKTIDLNISTQKKTELSLQTIGLMGYGTARIVQSTNTHILIKVEENPFAKEYKHLFGQKKTEKIDSFLKGYLKRIVELSLNKKVITSEELTCPVNGSESCTFLIKY